MCGCPAGVGRARPFPGVPRHPRDVLLRGEGGMRVGTLGCALGAGDTAAGGGELRWLPPTPPSPPPPPRAGSAQLCSGWQQRAPWEACAAPPWHRCSALPPSLLPHPPRAYSNCSLCPAFLRFFSFLSQPAALAQGRSLRGAGGCPWCPGLVLGGRSVAGTWHPLSALCTVTSC